MKHRYYQGQHREIDELEVGGSVVLKKPSHIAVRQFSRSVSNAVTHLGASRRRRFTTRATLRGVLVTRVPTEAELAAAVDAAAADDLM